MNTLTAEAQINTDAVVAEYLELWNTADPEVRLTLLRGGWHPEVSYVDPLAEVQGTGAMNQVIGTVREQFAGMVFSPVGTPDGHHRQVRFQWGLGPAGAEPLAIGFDVLTLDEQGRVADVRGFLDRVPG